MTDDLTQQEARKYLAAFADGELDVQQNLKLLDALKLDPQASARVMHQQQLRQVVGRSLRDHTPAPSAALRQRVEQLLGQPTDAAPAEASPPASYRFPQRSFRRAAAPAAVLALAGVTLYTARLQLRQTGKSGFEQAVAQLVSDQQVELFASRHVTCSQVIDELHRFANAPSRLEAIPAFVARQLGSSVYDSLDLAGVGYAFEALGQCEIAGPNSVHLIYRAKPETGRTDALSLWIAADDGRLKLPEGVMYRVRGPEAAHPLLVWRQGGSAYFLVGDFYPGVDRAYVALATQTPGAPHSTSTAQPAKS